MIPNWRARTNRIAILTTLAAAVICEVVHAANVDWGKVDLAIGRKGTAQSNGIHKYGLPRSDMKITVDGVALTPAFALGSWAAFQPSSGGAMVMGDLVLTDTELSPVMKYLIENGFEISAIHNHLLRTSVPVVYMHIVAHGDPLKLARTLHEGLALSKTPLNAPASAPPVAIDLDTAAIEKTLGAKGSANGGVYQFGIPRAEEISEHGMSLPPSMGTATAINFQPTGGGKTAITGDFVLLGSEVNPVLKTLRQHGIEVTALHSHMIGEIPRLYFMHFWANDNPQKLAEGLRRALDLANLKRAS